MSTVSPTLLTLRYLLKEPMLTCPMCRGTLGSPCRYVAPPKPKLQHATLCRHGTVAINNPIPRSPVLRGHEAAEAPFTPLHLTMEADSPLRMVVSANAGLHRKVKTADHRPVPRRRAREMNTRLHQILPNRTGSPLPLAKDPFVAAKIYWADCPTTPAPLLPSKTSGRDPLPAYFAAFYQCFCQHCK